MASEVGRRLLLVVSVALCQLYFARCVLDWDWALPVRVVSKGGPVLLMGFVALTAPADANNAEALRAKVFSNRVGVGLALSSLGDVTIELEHGFLPALGFFLIAHLCYMSAFEVDSAAGVSQRLGSRALLLGRLVLAFWGMLVLTVYGFLSGHVEPDLRVPVAAYTGTIGVMVYRAVARFDPRCGTESYYSSAVGAVVFAFSDFVLAYDKFVEPMESARYTVILFYYIGQIALCNSTLYPPPAAAAAAAAASKKAAAATAASKKGASKKGSSSSSKNKKSKRA